MAVRINVVGLGGAAVRQCDSGADNQRLVIAIVLRTSNETGEQDLVPLFRCLHGPFVSREI